MACPASRINEALWGALNQTVISGHEDGSLRLWDVVSRRRKRAGEDRRRIRLAALRSASAPIADCLFALSPLLYSLSRCV